MLVEYVCHGSVTLCNGKTLGIPKTLERIMIGVFPSHRKMSRGQHINVYVQKILFMIDQRIVGVEVCPLLPFLASLHIYIPVH